MSVALENGVSAAKKPKHHDSPPTQKPPRSSSPSLEMRCLHALRAFGIDAEGCTVDPGQLKGGYICNTVRVHVSYAPGSNGGGERPATVVVKQQCPDGSGGDHEVALRLKLYEREWQFYESGLAGRVPIRVPKFLGSLKDSGGQRTVGVLLEDLCGPSSTLNPALDEAGVVLVARHAAKMHAQYWGDAALASGALGIRRHDDAWFKPSWQQAIAAYWPKFEAKWRGRPGALPEEAFAAGKALATHFEWVQTAVSEPPFTFIHGDIKPGNMFMLRDSDGAETPAFIDWQYTAVGKGAQDLAFMIIEGYDIPTQRRLEPVVQKAYLEALHAEGVTSYTAEQLRRDWQLATLHFPFYVAMWFGTTPDEELVDPDFPRRFVPRAFDAILRNDAQKLLPTA